MDATRRSSAGDGPSPTVSENFPSLTPREYLQGLALGFGAVGAALGIWSIPVLLFVLPLGFGFAGGTLAIASALVPGRSQTIIIVAAVIGSIVGIAQGIEGYNQWSDAADDLGF